MSTTPPVITRYLAAADDGDYDTVVACFTEDGTVLDEGQTYRGRHAIRGWRESLRSKWEFTTTITGSEPDGDARHIVRTHVEGSFPGGVADLRYQFTLAGDQIADLAIVP
jgi:ketosteroid isomerase-like protein